MSAGISPAGIGDFSLMNTLVGDSAQVKQRLDQLTIQASDGLVSNTYAGLGGGAAVSLNLAPQIAALQTWQNNISTASGNMQVAQTAMTQLQSIASSFYAQLPNLNGLSATEVDSMAASARQALTEVAGLLDTQDGGVYVFGGQDTGNPPVPDPDQIDSSGFYTQIAAAVAGLSAQRRGGHRGLHPGDRQRQHARHVAVLGLPVAVAGRRCRARFRQFRSATTKACRSAFWPAATPR